MIPAALAAQTKAALELLRAHHGDLHHVGTVRSESLATRLDDAVDVLEAGLTWQPMETAPKDGTMLLLWARDRYAFGHGSVPRREGPMRYVTASWSGDLPTSEPYWRWSVPGYSTEVIPTHWMALPPEPAP